MKENCENIYRRARKGAGLTQELAAELLHVSPRSLSDYETGRSRPHDDTVSSMVDAYDCHELGYLHLRGTELGRKVLLEIALPATNEEAAMKIYSAAKSLQKTFRLFRKIIKESGGAKKSRAKSAQAKKTRLVETVRRAAVEADLFLKKAAAARKSAEQPQEQGGERKAQVS